MTWALIQAQLLDLTFAQVNLRAAFLKMHVIHKEIQQVDPSTVRAVDILTDDRTGNLARIEALPLVLYDNKHSAPGMAGATYANVLASVLLIAVNDGVGQRLAQGGLDFEVLIMTAFMLLDAAHELVHHRRNRFNLALHYTIKFQGQMRNVEFAGLRQIRRAWWTHHFLLSEAKPSQPMGRQGVCSATRPPESRMERLGPPRPRIRFVGTACAPTRARTVSFSLSPA
jgi:hypothetical protein